MSVNWTFAGRDRVGHELILIRAIVDPAHGHLAARNTRVSSLAALIGQPTLTDDDLGRRVAFRRVGTATSHPTNC